MKSEKIPPSPFCIRGYALVPYGILDGAMTYFFRVSLHRGYTMKRLGVPESLTRDPHSFSCSAISGFPITGLPPWGPGIHGMDGFMYM